MKTLELKLKKDVLIVDLPIDAKNVYMSGNSIIYNSDKSCIVKPINDDYEFLCKGSDLTEEIASELVHKSIHTGLYAYYVDNIPVNAYCYNSAKEAVISKVESKGFHWLKHNIKPFSLYDPRSKTGCHDLEEEEIVKKQWQKAEEKTFKNPLIFVKK